MKLWRCASTDAAAMRRKPRGLPAFAFLVTLPALAALAIAAAKADPLPSFDRVRVLEARSISDAELTDQNGRAVHLGALRGKVAFVLFGYTNCPDVCPSSMERLRELHDSGGVAKGSVAYVMISVDGERDTPAAMKAFLAKYSADFIGLTADPSLVKPIAAQFAATYFKGGHKGHGGGYDVGHSPQIFVLDQRGRLRAEAYGASTDTMAKLANALLAEAQ
jgi:protein SCO1